MEITAKLITEAKSITLIKQSNRATTSLLESQDGIQYIIKQYNQELANSARTEYLFLQSVKDAYAVKALGLISQDSPTLVLEHIAGNTLSNHTFTKWDKFEECFAHIAYSLSIIHAYGICLNDIKPDNIIVSKDFKPYLVDFEFATINLFFEREFRGTPAYAAPEKFIRYTNHYAADLFSLGMVMFYCKHGKTMLDIFGEEEYYKLIAKEELWQKQLELMESDEVIKSLLSYNPYHRPLACEIALSLAEKHNIKLNQKDRIIIDNITFKTQMQAMDKLWKKKSLICDYSDEPQKIENLLSLWSENSGKKLLVLDESVFVSQPDEFFLSFPMGYRETSKYQPRFIEWLEDQQLAILLRRYKQFNPTSFFDDILQRTDAMQMWIGEESDVKPVSMAEINELSSRIASSGQKDSKVRKQIKSAKPFYIRLFFMEMVKAKSSLLDKNELISVLSSIQTGFPLVLTEKVWDNWHVLVQDGLLKHKLAIEGNVIKSETKQVSSEAIDKQLMLKIVDLANKSGFYNISGEVSFFLKQNTSALEYWGLYLEDLIKKEFFLSAYEFVLNLKKRINPIPFEFQKKEAFLARICGNFELSNKLYNDLINSTEGLTRAVLSVDRAIVLQALKRFDEAITTYKNAIELFRMHKDLKSQLRAMNNLGVVYFGLQRYTDAEQLFNDVLNESKLHDNIQFETLSYLNLSDIHLRRGDWKKVLYFTDKAKNISRSNSKWHLYANGCIIQARALFALGDYDKATQILLELKESPKINENVLIYQETLAWLIYFAEFYQPELCEAYVNEVACSISNMHEILKRELFFYYYSRNRYFDANSYLRELDEISILKDYFNYNQTDIIQKLIELKTQSELDSFFYYTSHLVMHFPSSSYQKLNDYIGEALELSGYAPLSKLLNSDETPISHSAVWALLINKLSECTTEETIIQLCLSFLSKQVKVDKYLYLEANKDALVPLVAMDNNYNTIPAEKLLLSNKLLDYISEKRGYFYLNPAYQFIESEAHSSLMGLGVVTVCGFTILNGEKLKGVFYLDSKESTAFTENDHSFCQVIHYLMQSAFDKINRDEYRTGLYVHSDSDASVGSLSIIGNSKAMREVYSKINTVAGYNVNVLITGPTGSGKELVARELHKQYIEKNNTPTKTPFIAVNCAAIPEQLLESELFGYKKGAFTGAVIDKKGKILLADNGTIFLDEIGEMPILLQSKLLRVIQE
jgi:serine/threonine protein kinase/tetratricopeptide (TPR) repeat protein